MVVLVHSALQTRTFPVLNYLARASSHLRGLATASTAVVQNARRLVVRADVLEGSRIAIVAVDARDLARLAAALARGDALDVDVALALAAAVAARAVDLAVVLGVEVDDVDGAAAVVLDDLV
jgi:hypothetical protein